jgi:hypothetical protein
MGLDEKPLVALVKKTALLNQIRGFDGGSLIQLPATVGELRAPGPAADVFVGRLER